VRRTPDRIVAPNAVEVLEAIPAAIPFDVRITEICDNAEPVAGWPTIIAPPCIFGVGAEAVDCIRCAMRPTVVRITPTNDCPETEASAPAKTVDASLVIVPAEVATPVADTVSDFFLVITTDTDAAPAAEAVSSLLRVRATDTVVTPADVPTTGFSR
jgi:hypothetical protein